MLPLNLCLPLSIEATHLRIAAAQDNLLYLNRLLSYSKIAMEIEEILNLIRISFDAAARFARSPKVHQFWVHPRPAFDIYEVIMTFGEDDYGVIPADTPNYLRKALVKWGCCDCFCYIVLEAAKKALESEAPLNLRYSTGTVLILKPSEYGATVRWVRIWANPIIALSSPLWDYLEVYNTAHSLLEVRLSDGSRLYFDGTVAEYAWKSDSWLLSPDDFRNHVLGPFETYRVDEFRLLTDFNIIMGQDTTGYWSLVSGSLWQMFEDMDWESLARMTPVARVRTVRRDVEARVSAIARKVYDGV